MDVPEPDEWAGSVLKWGLAEAVYEWARGTSFEEICQLTSEGRRHCATAHCAVRSSAARGGSTDVARTTHRYGGPRRAAPARETM